MTEDHLPKLSRGRGHGTKTLRYCQEFLDSRQRRKNLAGLGIDGHAKVLRSLRGDKIGLLVYHNPEGVTKREQGPDRLLGFLLRGGKNQLVVQVPKKTVPVRVSLLLRGGKNQPVIQVPEKTDPVRVSPR